MGKVMVARLNMRYFRNRGSGDELSDVVAIANVDLHSRTAEKKCRKEHNHTRICLMDSFHSWSGTVPA